VDVVAVGLFLHRGLTITAALYAVFLVLSVAGLIGLARILQAERRGVT
jgi:nicotinamide mononucleotide transporter